MADVTEASPTKLAGFDFWKTKLHGCQYVVAPMVDQSELAWRLLSRRYGAQLCYSPMFHSSVFARDLQYRREALQSCPEDRPLIIQFCANDPEVLLRAARLAEDHCEAIDLNLGCPQMIARRGHYGAFLQDEWELLEKMVSTCHQHLKVPITCKIRVFESLDKTVEYAKTLERAGCQLLTVHGRQREQKGRLTGLANWEYVKAIKKAVKIPVFSNGNIQYLSDVKKCLEETGVDGVMTAEGNLHNPALFSGENPPVWQMVEEYLDLVEKYPCPMSYIRGHVFKILHHALHLHQDVRELIAAGKTADCLRKATEILKERCLKEMEDPDFDPKQGLFGELPLPYWYCQPYVRPSTEQAEKNRPKRDLLKRPLEIEEMMAEKGISKNKVKKRLRNPNKNFDAKQKVEYQFCVNGSCSNPRSEKCAFLFCKFCCRDKTSKESVVCEGHKKKKSKKYLDLAEKYRGLTDSGATDITRDKTKLTCGKSVETNNVEAVENGDTLQKCDSDTEMTSSNETKSIVERTQEDNALVGQETVNL